MKKVIFLGYKTDERNCHENVLVEVFDKIMVRLRLIGHEYVFRNEKST